MRPCCLGLALATAAFPDISLCLSFPICDLCHLLGTKEMVGTSLMIFRMEPGRVGTRSTVWGRQG